MDGIGRCLDNIFVERTWRTLKYECIFLHDYNTMTQLSNGLDAFIAFFNDERLHQGLDYPQLPEFLTLEANDLPILAMLQLDQTNDFLNGLSTFVHGIQKL